MAAARACLSCGYRLHGGRAAICSECGRTFDPLDQSTFGVRFDQPELLLETRQEWIGRAISAELFDAGVLNQVEVAASDIVVFASVGRLRIYVDRQDLPRSREVVSRRRLDAVAHGADEGWPCSNCGETVPASFDVCWSCGAERSEIRAGAEGSAVPADEGLEDSPPARLGAADGRIDGVADPSTPDQHEQDRQQWARGRLHSLLGGILFLSMVLMIALIRGAVEAAIGIGLVILLMAGLALYLNGYRGQEGT